MRLQRYDFVVCYARGNSIPVPDTLSQSLLMDEQSKLTGDEDTDLRIHNVIKSVIPNQQIEDKIREHTASDQELTDILNYMVHGWPEQINTDLRPYNNIRSQFSHREGMILYHERIVIPRSLRAEVLSREHERHLGMDKSKARARLRVYWPRLNTQIESIVEQCETCQVHRNR